MKSEWKILWATVLVLLAPICAAAQGTGSSVYSLNTVLDKMFKEMIPMCSRLIDIGRALGGFATLWYIGSRLWKHIARAEEIDFFPLLRPFAIGMAIMLFPKLIIMMNSVLEPTVTATRELAGDSRKAIFWNIDQQLEASNKLPPVSLFPSQDDGTDQYEEPSNSNGSGGFPGLSSLFSWINIKSVFKIFITEAVQILYAAAALCINTIRTFYLIVLAIIGPLAFALSIFDGFQHTLASWFARYINVFMWLPVANIFGGITSKILENMIVLDQSFFSSIAYIIFMIISIIGYTTVPNVAGYIIEAGGKDTLLHKVNNMVQTAGKTAVAAMI